MTHYRIYIDEVGNHDMQVASVNDPNRQFLTLFGVVIQKDHMLNIIQPEMDQIKRGYFQTDPDVPIIFHRKELVQKKRPFHKLLNRKLNQQFEQTILSAYQRWEYTAFTATIDKKRHLQLYGQWHRPPYVYALQVLLERYLRFLQINNGVGDVMIEARGKREDKHLKQAYGKFFLTGSGFVGADIWQAQLTTQEIKINPKRSNIAGLQLADLLAHAAHYHNLQSNGYVLHQSAAFSQKIVSILKKEKYYRSGKNRIAGFGMKMLP